MHLASVPYGEVVQTREIASQRDIPSKYLPSIIRTLARAGLIRTLRGNRGGVMLARPPEEVNVREVIEAVEGPISLVPCLRGPEQCTFDDGCSFKQMCEDLQAGMVAHLEGTTFADLTTKSYVNVKKQIGNSRAADVVEEKSYLND